MKPIELLHPGQRRLSKAYLINELRKAVFTWREQGYPGVTSTTKKLLQFWFSEDHIVNNEPFEFWFCQIETIETLIYVYEVIKKRNFIDMARDFGAGPIQGYDPTYDQYPLYAFKMAMSSGKTYAVERYRAWIDAGIRRWREYKEVLKPLSKKPVLFFQCPENKEADEIFRYVNSAVPDLKDKVLLIHTDSTGEVKKADLPKARKFAKTIDDPDPDKNPYEAIVSTLMLNEGWDVRNVNVIVGLRSYTSKRNHCQYLGRCL
jgi:hypothetical protein